jgi:DNA-damage-inducible protein D
MASDLPELPEYRSTMQVLENARRTAESGAEYWFAREIQTIFGYDSWSKFTPVVDRAKLSMTSSGIDPSHHVVQTSKMMEVGKGAKRVTDDYFLSRGACYLIAMNGDPSKPQIAAAQAYFATATRAREIGDTLAQDEKRLELREKVTKAFRTVSGVAKDAGVANQRQALFHDSRYVGLYGMSAQDVKALKGVGAKEVLFDRMGALELSANEFQMNLAAETIRTEQIKGEANVIRKNKEVAVKVRKTMIESGSRPPESLPADEPIKVVERRVKQSKKPNKLPSK